MNVIVKIFLLAASHLAVALLFINLSFMPPTAVPLRDLALSMNRLAGAFYVEQLSSSAHRGLILKSAVELGIFEVFGDFDEDEQQQQQQQQDEEQGFEREGEEGNNYHPIMPTTTSDGVAECLTVQEVQSRLSQKFLHRQKKYDRENKDHSNNNNNQPQQQQEKEAPQELFAPSIPALKDLLEALASMSLVRSCSRSPEEITMTMMTSATPEPQEQADEAQTMLAVAFGYSLPPVSRTYLNGRGRGSVRRNLTPTTSTAATSKTTSNGEDAAKRTNDDWTGMILTANSPAVIESLLRLTEKLTSPSSRSSSSSSTSSSSSSSSSPVSSLSISRAEESELWRNFAANTHEIFRDTAKFSARQLLGAYFSDRHKHSDEEHESNIYFDIGAGSAVVAEEFCRHQQKPNSNDNENDESGQNEEKSQDDEHEEVCEKNEGITKTIAAAAAATTDWKYVLVDLPEVIDYLGASGIVQTFCGLTGKDEVTLVEANATSGANFSKSIGEALEKTLPTAASASVTNVVFSLNSFLQHFDDEACVEILGQLLREAKKRLMFSSPESRIIFTIMELENPEEPFSAAREWLPTGRIFSVVLRAFTNSGFVRSERSYAKMLERVVADDEEEEKEKGKEKERSSSSNNEINRTSEWHCDDNAVRKVLFPLPASVSMISCVHVA